MSENTDTWNTAREMGGRFLLGPLRRAATAQVLKQPTHDNVLIRAVLRDATASINGPCPLLLSPTSLAWAQLREGTANA